ncbi:cyclin N-terminal domain-containing protein 1 isoform 2-T2 [Amazona ochrocephala]
MGSQAQAASRCRDPGPAFGSVAPEAIEDALIRLAAENEQHLSVLPEEAGCFREPRIVEFMFLLADQWHLDQAARYQAVELLERFMTKQVEQISKSSRRHCEQGGGSSWSSLEDQIYNTFVLRLVSCVQLASKLSLHYNRVTSDVALKFLQSLKYSYTKQELLESELAVLKALHFQVNVSTPLAYVELLLEVLGYNGCLLPTKPLHQMCIELLDFSYLARDAIYDTLLKITIENSAPSKLQVNHQHKRVHIKPWALEAGSWDVPVSPLRPHPSRQLPISVVKGTTPQFGKRRNCHDSRGLLSPLLGAVPSPCRMEARSVWNSVLLFTGCTSR